MCQAVRGLLTREVACGIRVARLRVLEAEPVMLETSHLPVALVPRLDSADLTRDGLYEWLADLGRSLPLPSLARLTFR
jgi:DNA-binding GntR family transcriptional regulator